MSENYGNKSIQRCFDILELLIDSMKPLSIKEIANELNMSVSAVHSLLHSIVIRGYARHLGPRKGYVVGPSFSNLCMKLSEENQFMSVAQQFLDELKQECDQETCYFSYLKKFYVENVFVSLSTKVLSSGRIEKRDEWKLHAMAQGKVLLAYLSNEDYLAWKSKIGRLEAFTPHTKTDFVQLEKELAIVRRQGYAENIEETEEGLHIIASPVFNYLGQVVACFAVGVPIIRMDEHKKKHFCKKMVDKGLALSSHLGFHKQKQ